MTNSDEIEFFVSDSGDGFELLDVNGDVIAWTLDKFWAWRIVLALEFFRDHGCLDFLKEQKTDLPEGDQT
jgi:hypothetical protein